MPSTKTPEERLEAKEMKEKNAATRITQEKWNELKQAWGETPTIAHLIRSTNVTKRIAKRAVTKGWPELGLPAFVEEITGDVGLNDATVKVIREWNEKALVKGELAKQAAKEAIASRIAMAAALKGAQMTQWYAAKVLAKFEANEVEVPEVTPKLIYTLVKSLETSTKIIREALEIERTRQTPVESTVSVEIGMLIERCNMQELEDVIASGGILPGRFLDQRRLLQQDLSPDDAEMQVTNPGDWKVAYSKPTVDDDKFLEVLRSRPKPQVPLAHPPENIVLTPDEVDLKEPQ
jgi:hypothetical protein